MIKVAENTSDYPFKALDSHSMLPKPTFNFFDYFSLDGKAEDNGELPATVKEENIWLAGDAIVSTRQALIITTIVLAALSPAAPIIIPSLLVSGSLIGSGTAFAGSGISWMAPRAHERLTRAELELRILESKTRELPESLEDLSKYIENIKIFQEALKDLKPTIDNSLITGEFSEALIQALKTLPTNTTATDNLTPLGVQKILKSALKKAENEAESLLNQLQLKLQTLEASETVDLERINLLNQGLFIGLGLTDIASGFTQAASYLSIIGPSLGAAILTFLADISGILGIIRGITMYYRASECQKTISSFKETFMEHLNNDIDKASAFIENERDQLKSRVFTGDDIKALELSDKEKELLGMPSKKDQPENEGALKKKYTLAIVYLSRRVGFDMAEKIMLSKEGEIDAAFLAKIDHAIYRENFKQTILKLVAVVTGLLGIGTLLAVIFSGGTAALVTASINAGFTLITQPVFVLYDRLSITKNLSDYFYNQSRANPALPANLRVCLVDAANEKHQSILLDW